jgi:hypothetical protein
MVEASMHVMKMAMGFVSACQHDGRILVSLTLVVASPSRHLSRKVTLVLGLFEEVHNAKSEGFALLSALLETLLT